MNFQDYVKLEGVNFSTLKWMAKSPLHYRHAVENGFGDKPHFALGRVAHTAVLEPYDWAQRYIVKPEEIERTKVNKRTGEIKTERKKLIRRSDKPMPEWVELQERAKAEGRQIITQQEHDKAVTISRNVLLNPMAADIFRRRPRTEVTIQWEARGIKAKSRLDIAIPKVAIVDLKTARDIEAEAFDRTVINNLYLAQGAFYVDAWHHETGEMLPFWSLPVESSEPHDVDLVTFSEEDLEEGREIYLGWVDRLIECQKNNHWPGVNATGKPRQFVRPKWAIREDDDTDGGGYDWEEAS